MVLDVMVPEVMEMEMEALGLADELTESVVLADEISELGLLLRDTVDRVVELMLLDEEDRLKLLEEEELKALLDDEMPVLLVGDGGSQLVEEELTALLDADSEPDVLDKDSEVSETLDNEESPVLLKVDERLKLLDDEVTVALLSVIERLLLLDEEDIVTLLESEEFPMLLDGDGALVVPLEMMSVLLVGSGTEDDDVISVVLAVGDTAVLDGVPLSVGLKEELEPVPLKVPTVLELLKLELVEAILDELIVSVLLTDDNEIFVLLEDKVVAELLDTMLLLTLDSVGLGDITVGHGGPVTNVFVKVDVTKSVDVFSALASPSLLNTHTYRADRCNRCGSQSKLGLA